MPMTSPFHLMRRYALCAGLLCAATSAIAATPADAASTDAKNVLSPAERREGFVSLFDGSTLNGWHAYRKPGQPIDGWKVVDGAITRTAEGGDLVSDRSFQDFDLRIDWKISSGGNSGIFYRGNEAEPAIYHSAVEYQILDNDKHADGKNGPDRWASAVYALYAPEKAVPRPVGEWNETRIVAHGNNVEHWLNGKRVAKYTLDSPDWKKRVAASKFKEWPAFGQLRSGPIGLQDHGDEVAYRNIRIRPLPSKPD